MNKVVNNRYIYNISNIYFYVLITGGAAGLVAGLVVGVLGARAVGKMMEARRINQEEEDEDEEGEEEDKVPITVVTEPSEEQKADTLDTVT